MGSRTIIDILRKGNQELFHSSIIAWLLDPLAEHGLDTGFLNAFAEVVEQRGVKRQLFFPVTTTRIPDRPLIGFDSNDDYFSRSPGQAVLPRPTALRYRSPAG